MRSSFICGIYPAVVMRVTVPVLAMIDQFEGGHSSEPSRPFLPSSSPYPDLHTRSLATRSWVNSGCFSPMQQQHPGEVLAHSSRPGSSTLVV
ncbi:hypothetical protein HU200_039750 [Digitaria exilis]|uniref:Uncharacterized protein n=1 Tax=Digitaria exilis TaxID=1010633 RepID=A0A835BA90_9POAL|nr:hypothetical protein HU200_039750 [Digitaria exilis]